ncbi:MAG: hypothetical protein H0V44_17510 [Planctomycetes bacterium]|nr:hypothetical protein [Planctomycetota bacterium]
MRHPLRNLFLLMLGKRVYKHYKNRKMVDASRAGRPYSQHQGSHSAEGTHRG